MPALTFWNQPVIINPLRKMYLKAHSPSCDWKKKLDAMRSQNALKSHLGRVDTCLNRSS